MTHAPETINVTATIVWDDENNTNDIRPESVEVELYTYDYEKQENVPNGTKATLNEENGWKYTFETLPQYEHGNNNSYSVKQNNLPETYEESYDETYDDNNNGTFTFTNTQNTI